MHRRNICLSSLWCLLTILTVFFFCRAFPVLSPPSWQQSLFSLKTAIGKQVLNTYVPGIFFLSVQKEDKISSLSLLQLCVSQWYPLSSYLSYADETAVVAQSTLPQSLIASATDTDEDTSSIPATPSPDPAATEKSDNGSDATPSITMETLASNRTTGITYSAAQLSDFSFLLNSFFTLDSTTTVDDTILNGSVLTTKDLSITQDSKKPQILIYHTHSQEEFADSIPGDPSTTIVGVGDYLTTLLRDVYGYNVIHNTSTFDLVDGSLDRNKAYTQALHEISALLEANPSIEVVIDLHRDGINGNKMTTLVNGKETAKLMFFNGLSRTAKNGEISYLYNPYIQDNLSFSLQLQLKANQYYPDVMRPIYLKGYRYNLHLRPRCLLVEAGSQKNTLQEERNAMEVLADLLHMVLNNANR